MAIKVFCDRCDKEVRPWQEQVYAMMITTVFFTKEMTQHGGPIGTTTASPKAKFDHLCGGCAGTLSTLPEKESK